MGLDVYLYKCADKETADRLEAEYERGSDEVWASYGAYDSMTDDQKEEARTRNNAIKQELGLGEWGESPAKEKIEHDDGRFPDHYFKIGYFRSSYNDGGINNVLKRRLGLPDLYAIFEPGDQYEFAPNWAQSLERARDTLARLRERRTGPMAGIDCFVAIPNMFTARHELPNSAEAALAIYKGEKERASSFQSYSNISGIFHMDGLECYGFIPGMTDSFDLPCTYIIYKSDGFEWYEQALEIVIATIEYVMAQPDIENYYLVWSS